VPYARRTLESGLARGSPGPTSAPDLPPEFEEKRGAFVTLKRHPSGDLRGCVGYPLPVLPLRLAVARAAIAAATDDPRFRPVGVEELPRLTVEVSVLTPPQLIEVGLPDERVQGVRVGRDGLIVEGYGASGLLLPQVAPEQGWDAEEFLDGTCEKAGLPPAAWRDPRVRVLRFEADVFAETSPRGSVVRVALVP
jgi:uncharacterized protein